MSASTVRYAALAMAMALGGCTLLNPLGGFAGGPDDAPANLGDGSADGNGNSDAGGDGGAGRGDAASGPGRIFVFGGASASDTNAALADVIHADIQADGALGPWTASAPLPQGRRIAEAVSAPGVVALVGGSDGSSTFYDTVLAGTIDANGDIVSWTPAPITLPNPRGKLGAVISGLSLYVVGGTNPMETPLSDVEIANATLSSFTAGPALPFGIGRLALAASPTSLYLVGGNNGAGDPLSSIYVAHFQATGGLDGWTTAATLPSARAYPRALVHGSALVVVGGEGVSGKPIPDSVAYPILASGMLGPVIPTTSLPISTSHHLLFQHGAHVYVIGGIQDSLPVADCWVGDIADDGTITAWRATTALPQSLAYHAGAIF